MTLRFFLVTALLLFFTISKNFAQVTACIDSAVLKVNDVNCYGLNTGSISVLEVFHGIAPFYFSKDSINWFTDANIDKLKAGKYNLFIKDGADCVYKKSFVINEPPLLQVYLTSNRNTVKSGEPFTLTATVAPENVEIKNITWRSPSYFKDQQKLEQTINILEEVEFYVNIITTDGCNASALYTQKVEKTNYYLPNVFKPGSNANSYFTIFSDYGIFSILSLEIFDRWGTRVFNNQNFLPNEPEKGWNGRFKNKKVSNGTYFYVAKIKYIGGDFEILKGDVMVSNEDN
jgi:gliding motility-associated-like protein